MATSSFGAATRRLPVDQRVPRDIWQIVFDFLTWGHERWPRFSHARGHELRHTRHGVQMDLSAAGSGHGVLLLR